MLIRDIENKILETILGSDPTSFERPGSIEYEDAVTRGLDMSTSARFARAEKMGFDTKTIYYHGTGQEITNINRIFWGGKNPTIANDYAFSRAHGGGSPNVIPFFFKRGPTFDADKMRDTITVDVFFTEVIKQATDQGRNLSENEFDEVIRILSVIKKGARVEESGPHYSRYDMWYESQNLFGKEAAAGIIRLMYICGFDKISMTERRVETVGAFNPHFVRSIFAAFDPDKTRSSNIMDAVTQKSDKL